MSSENLSLQQAWAKRCRLVEKSADLWATAARFRAASEKLREAGYQHRSEGNKLWSEAVREVRGNIAMTWEWIETKGASRCLLETGEVFEP